MSAAAEVLILGGGVMGLAIALELRSQGAKVCVVCRDFEEAASHAAAGMLAPQAEGLPPGPMLDLCLRSRDLYPTWIPKIQSLSGQEAGYWQSGILAPSYCGNYGAEHEAEVDRAQIHQIQPGLSDEVQGGNWFPEDAQVDNRKLARALWGAALAVGVEIRSGVTVTGVKTLNQRVVALESTQGDLQAAHYILATGAWSQDLLPVPVTPRKGQMISVRVQGEMPLKTVLFGNTPAGIMKLLKASTRLFPAIADYVLEDFWYGYRPATPDELPILGESPYPNLTYATGHYRNGILLTPITGKIIADWVWNQARGPLLSAFHWSRLSP
jgi:glycine/D-amino acid oxidase-like deaminating enzyme